MPHLPGAYLGSVVSIDDIRLRCVIDGDCWHLRTAHGKAQPTGRVQRIWVHGRGAVSATRAVWELSRGRNMPKGRRAVRVCGSYDCANPQHIRALTHSEAQSLITGRWHEMTPARRAHLSALHRSKRKFTDQQLMEIRLGSESAKALSKRWNCSPTSIRAIRLGRTYRDPLASVFHMATGGAHAA